MKIFKNILTFLKLAPSTTNVELSEEQKEKIDSALGELDSITTERDTLQTKVTELEGAATTAQGTITSLQGQVTTLTDAKTKAEGEIVTLKAEVERLGKLDAGKFTTSAAQTEKKDEVPTELSNSQKELNEKMKDF